MSLIKKFNIELKCIFIHVPKVAGISIEESLFHNKVSHYTAIEYRDDDPDLFEQYYKFSFVRNPYERLASAYYYLKNGGRNAHDKEWSDRVLSDTDEFRDFVHKLKDEKYAKSVLYGVHFRPQYQFVCDLKQNIMVDYLGRYENLNNDFSKVCKVIGSDALLRYENKGTVQCCYDSIYSKSMRKTVSDLYEKDFEILKYPV